MQLRAKEGKAFEFVEECGTDERGPMFQQRVVKGGEIFTTNEEAGHGLIAQGFAVRLHGHPGDAPPGYETKEEPKK